MITAEHLIIENLVPKMNETEIVLLDLLDYMHAVEGITKHNKTRFAAGQIGGAVRDLLIRIRRHKEIFQPKETI